MGRFLAARMLFAAVAGGLLTAAVPTLILIGPTAAVVFSLVAGVVALVTATPFSIAVSRLYGDLPLTDDAGHCTLWCVLSFFWGAAVGGGVIVWFVVWLLEHAG